jgi:hypothetical protein
VVALWKDPTGGIREISLEPGAQGVLLSMSVDRATRHTADSRWPADDTTQLRDACVRQVRATAPGAEPAVRSAATAPGVLAGLDECELTVLSSWAEAVAEAGTLDELAEVAADAAAGAPWRDELGLAPPSPALAAAIERLHAEHAAADWSGPGSDRAAALVERVLRSAGGPGPADGAPIAH